MSSEWNLGRSETLVAEDVICAPGYAHGPERLLFSAVLFDGLQTILNHPFDSSERGSKKLREALAWVNTRGTEYIFSFDSVCDALGIEPEFLRIGVANTLTTAARAKKTRRKH